MWIYRCSKTGFRTYGTAYVPCNMTTALLAETTRPHADLANPRIGWLGNRMLCFTKVKAQGETEGSYAEF
jgi:hypothetical protein